MSRIEASSKGSEVLRQVLAAAGTVNTGVATIQAAIAKFEAGEVITKLNEAWVSISECGAVAGGNIAYAAINSTAINTALARGYTVQIPDGTFYIANTITIPAYKKLILGKRTIIKPASDIDMFILNNESQLIGGYIDVTGIESYSKSVIGFGDTGYIFNARVSGISIENTVTPGVAPTGTAINLDTVTATGDKFICYCTFKDFWIQGFKYGVHIASTANSNFANANFFEGAFLYNKQAVYATGATESNYFNITGQGALYNAAYPNLPNIYLEGRYNIINFGIFDLGGENLGTTLSNMAIELKGRRNIINGNIPDYQVINHNGNSNTIGTPLVVTAKGVGAGVSSIAGDQSNYLVAADRKFDVTMTYTNTADWDDYRNMFRVNGSPSAFNFSNPTSTTDNVEALINLGSAHNISYMGFSTKANEHPKRVVFGAYSSSDNVWHEKTLPMEAEGFFYWSLEELGWDVYSTITQLRYRFYEPNNTTSGTIQISTLFASCALGGDAYLPVHGGTIYGDLTVNSGYITVGSIADFPTASAAYRGKIAVLPGSTGVADGLYICLKDAADTYNWVNL